MNYKIKNKKKLSSKYKTFIIGFNGSVSSGKSTFAELFELLFKLLYGRVKLISTDSFIYPNNELIQKNIMDLKGFPISYNWNLLTQTINKIKKNKKHIIPRYDQQIGDISNKKDIIESNLDILLIDGINILNPKILKFQKSKKNVLSDYLDYSIYIDASEGNLKTYFINRLFSKKINKKPAFKSMNKKKFEKFAIDNWWNKINAVNLEKYILPYKCRSDLIMRKNKYHKVYDIQMKL